MRIQLFKLESLLESVFKFSITFCTDVKSLSAKLFFLCPGLQNNCVGNEVGTDVGVHVGVELGRNDGVVVGIEDGFVGF